MSVVTKRYSYWWENSAPDFAFQTQLPTYVDFAIVGAGFAGISTAYWLLRLAKKAKKKGLRVLIVDEAPFPGFKATGRMNGSVYLGSNRSAKHVADLLGKKTAEKLYAYSNQNNAMLRSLIERGVACDAEFNGGFRMASTAKDEVELDDSYELMQGWDYHSVRFDHNQSKYVMVAPYTKGSLFVPGEGMFDAFAFVNKVARVLRKNNVWIAYGARVQAADSSPAYGPQLYMANGHVVTAGKIVHTTTKTIPWDRAHEEVVYRREHVIRTEELSPDLDDLPLPLMPVELSNGLDSARAQGRAVMMTGGKTGLKKDPELNVTNDSGFNERVLSNLDRTMMHSLPLTNTLGTTHAWTYIETEMSDGLPLMGEIPDSNGHFANVAHGRNKFGLAFLGARNVAERLLRVKMSTPEFSIFNPKRLTRGE